MTSAKIAELNKTNLEDNGMLLEFINRDDITYDMCISACIENGLALEYVPWDIDNYDDICILACDENGLALEYAEEQNDEMCEIACDENGLALEYVINKTFEICSIAMDENIKSMDFMDEWMIEELGLHYE